MSAIFGPACNLLFPDLRFQPSVVSHPVTCGPADFDFFPTTRVTEYICGNRTLGVPQKGTFQKRVSIGGGIFIGSPPTMEFGFQLVVSP